jgi:methylmalonyl-CoA mutase N-terminal domain/subunit
MSNGEEISAEQLPLFYGPGDVEIDYEKDLGDPGVFPYTRGSRPPVRRLSEDQESEQLVRELSGEGHASRSNEQFRYLLAHGATALDVIGDTPSMASMDPDHPYARHSVGNQGVSICRASDFVALYKGIPLDQVSVSHSLPLGFCVPGLYLAARELGFDPAILRGSTILGPLFGEDTCYSNKFPLELHMRLATDAVIFCAERMPKFHPFVEDTYYISDGSIEIVDEMALGFIELREVVRQVIAKGLDVDRFAPRIALLVNCRMGFFEEIAKVRASRRIYARMMRDEFGAKDPRSLAVNVTAHTSGATMTAQQLTNNIVRGATQSIAMHIAGVRALEISAFDEAIRTPSAEAHLIGLRTQQVVQIETGVADVADPLGGSYYVEALTDEIERKIEDRVREIEGLGEIMDLSHQGYFRAIFADAMVERAREVDERRKLVVGVNVHQLPPDDDTLLRNIAEKRLEPAYDIVEDVRAWRPTRDMHGVVAALGKLEEVGRDESRNVVEAIVDALAADATIGECAGVLREVYGSSYDPLSGVERPGMTSATA